MKAKEGVKVWLSSFFNLDTRWAWVVNATPWSFHPQKKDPVHTVWEAGWASRPVYWQKIADTPLHLKTIITASRGTSKQNRAQTS
jgi:hypothetical protein